MLDAAAVTYLTARGISIACAERYGLISLSPDEVRGLLGRSDVESAGLGFAYPQHDGETPLVRVRLHEPLRTADGPVRYLQARNTPIRPFVTHRAWQHRQGAGPLLLTEGEAKALAAEEAGAAVIGIPGCWGWVAPKDKNPNGNPKEQPRALHPAFDAFRWVKRPVYVIPDSDAITNPKVRQAFLTLASDLKKRGAVVRMVVIPPGPDGEKVGVDDLLAHHGTVALERLVHDAPLARAADVGRYIKVHQLDHPLVSVLASHVKIERVRWWWQDRIPVGMITLPVGPAGLGKTTFILDLIARATRGQLPGEFVGTSITALVCSTEDHRSSVLAPRLLAAGAEMTQVRFLSGPGGSAFVLPDHLPALQTLLFQTAAKVVFIDPLSATLNAAVNTWRDADVRRALAPLAALAEREGVVPLGIMHLNRRETADVLTRISGAGAFGQAARSVLLFTRDPDDPMHRLVSQAKLNVGPEATPSTRFRLETRTVEGSDGKAVETSGVVWTGESHRRAEDLLSPVSDEDRGALESAIDVLGQILADAKETEAKEAQRMAHEAGVADRTLDRAEAILRVKKRFDGKARKWYWSLPKSKDASENANTPLYGALGALGALAQTRVNTRRENAKKSKDAKELDIETLSTEGGVLAPAGGVGGASLIHGVTPEVWDALPPFARKAAELFGVAIESLAPVEAPPAPARPKGSDKFLAERARIRREHWWVQQVDPIPEVAELEPDEDDLRA